MVYVVDSTVEAFTLQVALDDNAADRGRDAPVAFRRADEKKPSGKGRKETIGNSFDLRKTKLKQDPDHAKIENHGNSDLPKSKGHLLTSATGHLNPVEDKGSREKQSDCNKAGAFFADHSAEIGRRREKTLAWGESFIQILPILTACQSH
jgi:hypothetical protein